MKIAFTLLVVLALIIIGFWLFSVQQKDTNTGTTNYGQELNPYERLAVLEDVQGGYLVGSVTVIYKDGSYGLTARIEQLPAPPDQSHYHGWLSSQTNAQTPKALGHLSKDGDSYTQQYSVNEDLTSYDFYIVSIETIDNPSVPSQHIIEGPIGSVVKEVEQLLESEK